VNHFNELERGLPRISRGLLAERLRRLQQLGIVERKDVPDRQRTSYQLTRAGMQLRGPVNSLTLWGAKWAFGDPEPAELDPVLLLWWMRNRVYPERLPKKQIVVEFVFRPMHKRKYWLILKPDDVSVCLQYPGFENDALVNADLSALYQVWLGRRTFADALRNRSIEIVGTPSLVREFPRWFALSPVAELVRKAEKFQQ
jgi:hypothetical protein